MRYLIITLLCYFTIANSVVLGWSECGHHIIAIMAYNLLEPDEQSELIRILKAHPNSTKDFGLREAADDVERLLTSFLAMFADCFSSSAGRRSSGPIDASAWFR